jgi:hypothetical protein
MKKKGIRNNNVIIVVGEVFNSKFYSGERERESEYQES